MYIHVWIQIGDKWIHVQGPTPLKLPTLGDGIIVFIGGQIAILKPASKWNPKGKYLTKYGWLNYKPKPPYIEFSGGSIVEVGEFD